MRVTVFEWQDAIMEARGLGGMAGETLGVLENRGQVFGHKGAYADLQMAITLEVNARLSIIGE